MIFLRIFLLLLCLFMSMLSFADGPAHASKALKKLTIMSTESPPFLSETMKEQGAGIYALRQMLRKIGVRLEVRFAPWERAKVLAASDPTVDGIFPYASQDLKGFIYSKFIYEAPWVIIERKLHPIDLAKITDFKKITLGNVTGVELRPGVKELVEKGLVVETTPTDTANLLKLATRRVDFITMDSGVFHYRMMKDKELKIYRGVLQINPKPVSVTHYGLALKKTPRNEALLKEFNEATSVDFSNQLLNSYFKTVLEKN